MTSRIIIPGPVYDEMLAYCKSGHPDEVCGILAGAGDEVSKIYCMTNTEPSPVSYMMDPAEQFRAIKQMRDSKISMLAIFHSHPASAAYPSGKDVGLAFYDDAIYIIVSLVEKEPVVKAFSIKDGLVNEVGMVIRRD